MIRIIAEIRRLLLGYNIEEIVDDGETVFITLEKNPLLIYSDLKAIVDLTGDEWTTVSPLDKERIFIITTPTEEKLKNI